LITVAVIVTTILLYWQSRNLGMPVPQTLTRGQALPDFHAVEENGDPVQASDLHGSAAVMLFVRGNWCPFCSSQVEDFVVHYKEIVELGAKLILVTPKPQETTRRVAKFFDVEFDFWLDEGLVAARQLGLMQESGVPSDHQQEYGKDTLWPMALVIDPNGIIQYAEKSQHISDRPNPKTLLSELRAVLSR
jgi:peroxiredoxin